ncbi:MAG: hypothetical protein QGG53_18750 [Planctomycetota bacterium]|nr:hypothetical protein [Planctomycetota bacterium]
MPLFTLEPHACFGQRRVKVWYGGGPSQKLRVKKGLRVTIRARVKGEVEESHVIADGAGGSKWVSSNLPLPHRTSCSQI